MSTRLRVLRQSDLEALQEFLSLNPLENLFMAARIDLLGVEPARLGCPIYGVERDGELVGCAHVGANLVVAGDDPVVVPMLVDALGRRRTSQSIMGPSRIVGDLHEALIERWGASWSSHRDARLHQPLMAIDHDPVVEPDPRVGFVDHDHYHAYFEAAVRMYTEEVGASPLDSRGSYQAYVRSQIQARRAFGAFLDGRCWWKSDIGAAYADACQIQGVWLDPQVRGNGFSEAAMAQVVVLARQTYPTVSLYVNDYNERARKMYEAIGFETVGELATILY